MTTTIDHPRSLEVPPRSFVPEIEGDVTHREFLIWTGGLLVLAPYGRGRTKVPIEWRLVMDPDPSPDVGTAAQALRTAVRGRGVKDRRSGTGHRRS